MRKGDMVYISGKVSGLDPDETYEKFSDAELFLAARGYVPVNPMWWGSRMGEAVSYEDMMELCLSVLDNCKAIFLLDDWRKSRGAQVELEYAHSNGLEVIGFLEGENNEEV